MAKVLYYDGLDHVVDKIYDLINSGGSADFIVEQDKSSGWYYRKWASGVLEAWINTSKSVAMTTLINGQYYGNTTISISQFGFVETPTAVVTGKAGGAYFATKIDSSSATEIVLSSRASNTATTDVVFNISLRGLWKTFNPSAIKSATLDTYYPVGSIYMTINNVNPANLFGGTWEQIKDKFLLCAGDTYSAGATGGEATHTLTSNEMPSHRHGWSRAMLAWGVASETTLSGNQIPLNENGANGGGYFTDRFTSDAIKGGVAYTGGGSSHNNMPPYLTVYVWKRTA